MIDIDLDKILKHINESVDSVIHSKEIQDIKSTIKSTIDETIVEVKETVNESVKKAVPPYYKQAKKKYLPVIKKPKGKTLGILLLVFGWIMFSAASILGIIRVLISVLGGQIFRGLPFAFFIVLMVIGLGMTMGGNRFYGRIDRFKTYRKALEEKAYCDIQLLSDKVRKTDKFVIKELQRMMKHRWFLEGHLDKTETCFMATEEVYQQYLSTEEAARMKQEEEKRKAQEEAEFLRLHPENEELKAVIEEGKRYMREIRQVNDDIPSENISAKLYKLESVIGKIFSYIKRKPEKLPEIRKFITYYLPTTLKLVQAYYEFDTQPVQGENIKKGKEEIEETLDQMNHAFGKMFDQLFQDDVLDISSDISVLSTMLAKDGLMEDDFS